MKKSGNPSLGKFRKLYVLKNSRTEVYEKFGNPVFLKGMKISVFERMDNLSLGKFRKLYFFWKVWESEFFEHMWNLSFWKHRNTSFWDILKIWVWGNSENAIFWKYQIWEKLENPKFHKKWYKLKSRIRFLEKIKYQFGKAWKFEFGENPKTRFFENTRCGKSWKIQNFTKQMM